MTTSLEKPVTEYETDERTAWIDGLRQIAYLLEAHPGIPLPLPQPHGTKFVATRGGRHGLPSWLPMPGGKDPHRPLRLGF